MLQINKVQNVNLTNIHFSKNSLVLIKTKESVTNSGSVNTSISYIEVCELKDTKELTIIESLLKNCLAEFRVANAFEVSFNDTNIKQQRILAPFLNTQVIFRTDSEGKLSRALVSEIPFNKTALVIKGKHTIMNCESKNLKACIYKHSQAILAQCSYLSLIGKELQSIVALCNDVANKPATGNANKPATAATKVA
jgi:hypothetical protein